ncbi:MAG: YicC family protein [Bacteroidales bacterium]|nr:YicC family protein [Candidatus Colimorpha merdihippi]
MKSMTGFAKGQCTIGAHKFTIEIKTLNSKALDLIVKIPAILRSHELDIRSLLNRLERGKVEIYITDETDTTIASQVNRDLVVARYHQLMDLSTELHCSTTNLYETILSMSDVWASAAMEELSGDQWDILSSTIADVIASVDESRAHEGAVLELDFEKHVSLIEQKLNQIPQYEAERIETAKERIRRYFAESAIKEIDSNRFEQELIYYFEKLDITEEKIRLAKHIDYFRTTMATEEGSGKKLAFIAQEMGREINTTGSKANHVDIRKLVVEMKDELEKIKEQLGNIL